MAEQTSANGAIVPIFTLTEHAVLEVADPSLQLTARDRRRLQGWRRTIAITELRGGWRIEARGWIGMLALDAAHIRIIPAWAGGTRTAWQMLRALIRARQGIAPDFLPDSPQNQHLTDNASFTDLLYAEYRRTLAVLFRGGLRHADSIVRRDDGFLRGRPDLARIARRGVLQPDRIPQHIHTPTLDSDAHQVLAAALIHADPGALYNKHHPLYALPRDPKLQRDWKDRLHTALTTTPTTSRDLHYRNALTLAGIILAGHSLLPDDTSDPAQPVIDVPAGSFWLPLDRLFEAFAVQCVADWIARQEHAGQYRLRRSPRHSGAMVDMLTNHAVAEHVPDAVLDYADGRLIIDAKNKPHYAVDPVSAADRHQIAAYLGSFQDQEAGIMPNGVILYPADSGSDPVQLALHDARGVPYGVISIIGLPVRGLLDAALNGTATSESQWFDKVLLRIVS